MGSGGLPTYADPDFNLTKYLGSACGPANPIDVQSPSLPLILAQLDSKTSTLAKESGGNLASLIAALDATLFKTMLVRNERETALGAGKLFSAVVQPAGGANTPAAKLLNPNGSGITMRLKRCTIWTSVSEGVYLFFDATIANLSGSPITGLNRLQGGAAAKGTLDQSVNPGAFPSLTNCIFGAILPSQVPMTIDLDVQLPANHWIAFWGGAPSTIVIVPEWTEY